MRFDKFHNIPEARYHFCSRRKQKQTIYVQLTRFFHTEIASIQRKTLTDGVIQFSGTNGRAKERARAHDTPTKRPIVFLFLNTCTENRNVLLSKSLAYSCTILVTQSIIDLENVNHYIDRHVRYKFCPRR